MGVLIGAGLLIAMVIVLVLVVREVRRLKRTRPLQFRNALVRDAGSQAMTHDLPPEPAPAPPVTEPPPLTFQALERGVSRLTPPGPCPRQRARVR